MEVVGQAQGQEVADSQVAQAQVVEPQAEAEVVEVGSLPGEVVGVHKGVRAERHVLGAVEAAVEIRYYGDFT